MSSATTPTIQAARKEHRCSWCGEIIQPSSTYSRWRYFSGDCQTTVKMHPECETASLRELRNGGENEWEQHSGTRGMTITESEIYWQQLDELAAESPTEAAARVLGARLAADLDAAVLRGLDSVLGAGNWTIESLTGGRLTRMVVNGSPVETWAVDGQVIVKTGPIKTQMVGTKLVATRDLWCIADGQRMLTEPIPAGFPVDEQSLARAASIPAATRVTSSH